MHLLQYSLCALVLHIEKSTSISEIVCEAIALWD